MIPDVQRLNNIQFLGRQFSQLTQLNIFSKINIIQTWLHIASSQNTFLSCILYCWTWQIWYEHRWWYSLSVLQRDLTKASKSNVKSGLLNSTVSHQWWWKLAAQQPGVIQLSGSIGCFFFLFFFHCGQQGQLFNVNFFQKKCKYWSVNSVFVYFMSEVQLKQSSLLCIFCGS